MFEKYAKEQSKYGRNRVDASRLEYEKEVKDRTNLKLNWGVQNRWEQRELDEVLKNQHVRRSSHRDISQIKKDGTAHRIQEFHSVDEIYYFMDNLFTEGFDERSINMALDVFLRDFA